MKHSFFEGSYLEIYRSIIEHNPDAIFVIAKDGIIMEVNPVATETFGYTNERMKKMHYQDFLIPEQMRKVEDLGVSLFLNDGTTRHQLMKYADQALYAAKESGRNNVKIYNE